jgi:iron complex transport system substrate-binding protein
MNKILFSLFLTLSLLAKERVIALSPSINEIIFALDEGKSIVGNTKFSDYPKAAQNIPKVGGYFSVSLEKVISLNPDMIMLQNYDKPLMKKLDALHLKTMKLRVNTLQDIKNTILKIGQYYGKEKEAKKIINNIINAQKNTQNIVKNKRILIIINPTVNLSQPIYIVGHNLYLEEIILDSGNKNAYSYAFGGQPVLNLEKIIELNPDIIILLAPYLENNKITKKTLLEKWKNIPVKASRLKHIYVIDKEYAGIPSQRVELFLNDFSKILHDVKNP